MISVIVMLIVIGLLLYVVSLLPIDAVIMNIIRAVVIVAAVLYVLSAFGMLGHDLHFGRL